METRPMYSNLDNFSKWLSEQIDNQRLTITKLSKLSGVHQNTIRNYLARRCEPTLYNVRALVNALGYELGAIPK
jgi:transcriptional regulator with XRE-family HTH domain